MDYVSEIKYAAEGLIGLIFHERDQLDELRNEKVQVERQLDHLYRVQTFLELNPDLDDEGIGTAARWEAYFDVEPKHDDVGRRIDDLQSRIKARDTAVVSLCGSLLQLAKQGMSIVHAGRSGPPGRNVGSQALRDVVWHARNQSAHYDEGRCRPPIPATFEALAADFTAPIFLDYDQKNLAFEVVGLLGWTSYEHFEEDLIQLLRP